MSKHPHPEFPPNLDCGDSPVGSGTYINAKCQHWQACVFRCAWLDRARELEGLQKESWHHYLDEHKRGRGRSKRLMKMWRADAMKFLRAKEEALKTAEAWRVWGLQK